MILRRNRDASRVLCNTGIARGTKNFAYVRTLTQLPNEGVLSTPGSYYQYTHNNDFLSFGIKVKGLQVGSKGGSKFFIFKSKLDGCLEKSQLVAGIVSFSTELVGNDAFF